MSLLRPALQACPRAAAPRSLLPPRAPLRLFHAAARPARPAAVAAAAAPARRGAYSLGLGLGLAGLALAPQTHEPLHCDATRAAADPVNPGGAPRQPLISIKDLGFGTVSGACAGYAVKKGLRIAAILGGLTFILLQYLSSRGIVSIDWGKVASRWDSRLAATKPAAQAEGDAAVPRQLVGSNAARLMGRLIAFLTNDLQFRGTFVAGLVLGLRYG